MPEFHALTQLDRAPLLVKAPVFSVDSEVRAYHLELLSRVMSIDGYHLPEADPLLFESFEPFYDAIAQRLCHKFDPRLLTSLSRQQFFISMGVEPDPDDAAKLVVSLSGLERLMGFTHHRPIADSKAITLTSGDTDMDLLASLELIFQDRVAWLVDHHARADLLKLLSQAQNIRRGKEAIDELQSQRDRAFYEEHQTAIDASFRDRGGFTF